MMLQFENHALARRKPRHSFFNVPPQFLSEENFLGICIRAHFGLAIEEILRVAFRSLRRRSLILRTAGAPPQMIESRVRNNPVEPGVEATFEAKSVQVAVGSEKTFLVDVPGVFRPMDEIQRQPQHVPIVPADEFIEGRAVAGLGLAHQCLFLGGLRRGGLACVPLECDGHPQSGHCTHGLPYFLAFQLDRRLSGSFVSSAHAYFRTP